MVMDLEKRDLDMQSGSKVPLLAIWMVTYNQELFIQKAVESVMMQKTSFDYKLYIGEDLSLDNTRQICTELSGRYSDRIEICLNKMNIGASQNAMQIYKKCFESGAKYIAMLEGDDYWTDPYKLQKQVDFLEANPDYVLCFHKIKVLKPNGELVDDFITRVPKNYETQETLARLGNYIHTPSVVFRNVIKDFPFEYFLTTVGDYFLYLLLAKHGKLKYLDQEMAVYRFGVGMHSANSIYNQRKNQVKLFTLLLSVFTEEKLKKIFLERQFQSLDRLEKVIHNEYDEYFVSKHVFFRGLKILHENQRNPEKIFSKIIKYFKK